MVCAEIRSMSRAVWYGVMACYVDGAVVWWDDTRRHQVRQPCAMVRVAWMVHHRCSAGGNGVWIGLHRVIGVRQLMTICIQTHADNDTHMLMTICTLMTIHRHTLMTIHTQTHAHDDTHTDTHADTHRSKSRSLLCDFTDDIIK